ncbi:MAG: membrane-bound lytic murein transglycosylase MltF [Bacterioplanes sp.]|nr:membrane-bound lytic murein transglycosylase MltF [Bacterioplanes sp.]
MFRGFFRLGLTLVIALATLSATTRGVGMTELDRILESQELVMITRNAPTTFYEDRSGLTGYEYELAKAFADYLGVELRVVVADHLTDLFTQVDDQQVAFAAAGITANEERQRWMRFSSPYSYVNEVVVYQRQGKEPKDISDLIGTSIVVATDSSHAIRLRTLQQTTPTLSWRETQSLEVTDLLHMVSSGQLDYTIVDSNEFDMLQAYFPNLATSLVLSERLPLAWAFRHSRDDSLVQAANAFFESSHTQTHLTSLNERFYGHLNQLDYVGARYFLRQTERKLDQYKPLFVQAAEQYEFDWRLLAAVGYQESHWNPRARSFTGVRGMMMLTLNTSRELGVTNRLDPKQSVDGGSRYLAHLRQRLAPTVQEPDRTWLALAAYNVGFGHLTDARRITTELGGDPNLWADVKEALPLLSQKRYYHQTRHGYARGQEPVDYVQNIRRYYDMLVWRDEQPGLLANSDAETIPLSAFNMTHVPPLL